jgi:hypothetical protein
MEKYIAFGNEFMYVICNLLLKSNTPCHD